MHSLQKTALIVGAIVVVGTAVAYAVGSQARTSTPNSVVRLRDVAITRGDLVLKMNVAGSVVGTPLDVPVSAQASGVVTWLPPNGAVVGRGETLFRVDDQPVLLVYGSTPSWRAFGPGMTDGPDIAQLQTNLLALGIGQRFGLVADGHYSDADRRAVAALAQAKGIKQANGALPFGAVIFEPGPVLVVGHNVPLGGGVSPGTPIVLVVGTTPQILAQANASNGSLVKVGTPTAITIEQNQPPLAGRVTALTSTPPAGLAGGAPSQGSGQSLYLTIGFDNPPNDLPIQGTVVAVQLKAKVIRDVLIVPVTAIVALMEGGYALEVDDGSGRSHLVPITVGAIDTVDALAEVSGAALKEGLQVEMPGA